MFIFVVVKKNIFKNKLKLLINLFYRSLLKKDKKNQLTCNQFLIFYFVIVLNFSSNLKEINKLSFLFTRSLLNPSKLVYILFFIS